MTLRIDIAARQVHRSGEPVHLTPLEWQLLTFFLQRAGTFIPHDELLNELWPGTYNRDGIYCTVAQLRRKLGSHIVETVHTTGYRVPHRTHIERT